MVQHCRQHIFINAKKASENIKQLCPSKQESLKGERILLSVKSKAGVKYPLDFKNRDIIDAGGKFKQRVLSAGSRKGFSLSRARRRINCFADRR